MQELLCQLDQATPSVVPGACGMVVHSYHTRTCVVNLSSYHSNCASTQPLQSLLCTSSRVLCCAFGCCCCCPQELPLRPTSGPCTLWLASAHRMCCWQPGIMTHSGTHSDMLTLPGCSPTHTHQVYSAAQLLARAGARGAGAEVGSTHRDAFAHSKVGIAYPPGEEPMARDQKRTPLSARLPAN
jgi:hypothetical protein